MDAMDNYEQNCSGTTKQAKFESAAAINKMKAAAFAEICEQQESFRQQQEEQGNALLDYLKSQDTAGDAAAAVTQATDAAERAAAEMKAQLAALQKELADLKAQATTPVTSNTSTGGTTGHAVNSQGVACPTRMTRRGLWQFINPQLCNNYGKTDFHLPQDCFSLPQNASKRQSLWKGATKKEVEHNQRNN